MNNQIKGGKKPLSSKPDMFSITDTGFGDNLAIEPALKKEIESKGLEYRWVDYKQMHENGGLHKNGWRAYKRENANISDSYGFRLGNDPNGLERRGHCLLAVRPTEVGDQHRALLVQKASIASKEHHKKAREEMRETAKEAGIKISGGVDED